MAEYHQYCPVARASEIFADRWTPLIVREMLAGSQHFNEFRRGLPGISRSLLVARLRHLEDSGVVQRNSGARSNITKYVLTEAGSALKEVIEHIGAWGVKWAFGEPKAEELDPALLLWKIHQRIDRSKLPPRRTVVQFDLSGRKVRRVWLILETREVSVCLKPPGFDPDLILRADTSLLYSVWVGHVDYDVAVHRGQIVVDGPRDLARALPQWFMWSPMARFVRACREPQQTNT
jgi:DNA-binding HxlR family transcriptional regulator